MNRTRHICAQTVFKKALKGTNRNQIHISPGRSYEFENAMCAKHVFKGTVDVHKQAKQLILAPGGKYESEDGNDRMKVSKYREQRG